MKAVKKLESAKERDQRKLREKTTMNQAEYIKSNVADQKKIYVETFTGE